MYIIMNFGMSYSFSKPKWDDLQFPAHFKIDYIREPQADCCCKLAVRDVVLT